jgi:hypothetical protein
MIQSFLARLLLDPLARVALGLALLVPVWGAASHALVPRAELRWAVVNTLQQPRTHAIREREGYGYGFTVMLSNEGNAATDAVRVYLAPGPEHVDVLGQRAGEPELSPTEEGTAVTLGALEAGAEVAVVVFGISPLDAVTVIEGGLRVEGTDWDVTEFDDPRPWLPDWAIRLGGLLLVALALEVLGLRARLGRAERDGAGGAAKGAGRENRGGPISA